MHIDTIFDIRIKLNIYILLKLLCFNCVCCCKVYGCTLNLLLKCTEVHIVEEVCQCVYECTDHLSIKYGIA